MSGKPNKRNGPTNQRRGKAFEELVVERVSRLGLSLTVKRIDRTFRRGSSLPDVEFTDFPDYKVDCKHTVGDFSWAELERLFRETKRRYCKEGGVPILITREWKGKSRMTWDNVRVVLKSRYGLTIVLFDNWLKSLEKELQNG